jgi:glycosyltransferase involved in cell wall biosynthesis
MLARRAAGAVAYGTQSRDYLISLGIAPEQVAIGINTVDTAFFAERTAQLRAGQPCQGHVFTYVGYLSTRKNVGLVLKAMRDLRRQRHDFVLEIVGDGDDRPNLERFVEEEKLGDVIRFHGYRQRDEIPAFLARSDAFVFQTDRDIWGLVLNEAMAAGVPCLASPNAGATHDLVRDGVTGFIVDFDDTAEVCRRLAWIMEHREEARAMGRRASAFMAQDASIARSAEAFTRAITDALQQ